jgi:hypothetical protein
MALFTEQQAQNFAKNVAKSAAALLAKRASRADTNCPHAM